MQQQTEKNTDIRNANGEIIQELNEKHWYCQSADMWFLIGGLVLFNISCFVNPRLIDRLFQLADFRFYPWWYFIVPLLFAAFSAKWFLQCRSQDKRNPADSKAGGQFFYLLWLAVSTFVVLRIVFDVSTYFIGSTLAVRTVPSDTYEYLLHFPPGYTDFGKPRPLILFLHGASGTNKGLDHLKEHDFWYCIKGHIAAKDFPFIVVSPTTPKHGWEPQQVKRLIEHIVHDHSKRYRIDPNRIYLTGYSMGGFGTFRTACAYPEMFAAIVPVAGGGEPEQAGNLKNVPTWAFHGDQDEVVPYDHSAKMIDAMKEAGNTDARLTNLHGAGHGIVGEVYQNPELYPWMLTYPKRQ